MLINQVSVFVSKSITFDESITSNSLRSLNSSLEEEVKSIQT